MDPSVIQRDAEELVPLAEGARRLGLAHDTARKHLVAGALRGEKRAGKWWIWASLPDISGMSAGTDPATSGSHPASSGTMPDLLVAALEDRIESLERQLAERVEENRRKDQMLMQKDQTIAALANHLQALPATIDVVNVPQDAKRATLSDDLGIEASQTLPASPAPQELGLRRWWRRLIGAE